MSKNAQADRQLLMNDHCSTYFDCIRHISKHLAERTALVAVKSGENTQLHSVHSVINGSSKIQCLDLNNLEENITELNKAYWRSCAFLLGAVTESSFRNEVILKNILPLKCNVHSLGENGRFGYSAVIKGLKNWEASKDELGVLTRACFEKYISGDLLFEPLVVSRDVARDMYKQEAIESNDANSITVYKLGDYVDVTDGPLIASTKQIGRFAITKVKAVSDLYAFYGVSVPSIQKCSSFSWDLIVASSRSSLNEVKVV
uniref:tRNA_SAD domain-containing protein n=1 Tax=Syphacia muris TaxID=451379 RepID=A0A0N5AK06_9BILA